MVPEVVGSHWSTSAQMDVVGVNWHDKTILVGKCKWGVRAVGRSVILELIKKTPKVVSGEEWQVYYTYFARAGFTDAAREEAQKVNALLVDLETEEIYFKRFGKRRPDVVRSIEQLVQDRREKK
jgi:hypothetical protein